MENGIFLGLATMVIQTVGTDEAAFVVLNLDGHDQEVLRLPQILDWKFEGMAQSTQ
jgi:hypothetical protein